MEVTSNRVIEIVRSYGDNHMIDLPDEFERDFHEYVGDVSITSLNILKNVFCKKVAAIFEGVQEMDERYGEIYGRISAAIRIKIGLELGFCDYVQRPMRGMGKSPREILKNFLDSLDDGQSWISADLMRWTEGGQKYGQLLYNRVATNIGWNLEVVRTILGDNDGNLLARNPYAKQEKRVRNRYDARRYLREFLADLPENEGWNAEKLYGWQASDGLNGASVLQWVRPNFGGVFNLDIVRQILGARADELLAQHPFTRKETYLRNEKDAKKYLIEFLNTLSVGLSWSNADLVDWTSESGVKGHVLYNWILRRFNRFDGVVLRDFLESEGEVLLANNPFVPRKENYITSKEKAKEYLMMLLDALPNGEEWSSATLQLYGKICTNGPTGSAVYSWILLNCVEIEGEGVTERAIRVILGSDADTVLAGHPFVPRKIDRIIDRVKAKYYLILFMEALDAGESWSPNTIQLYGHVADGVFGYSIYDWIARNEEKGFNKDGLCAILGEDADRLLREHPFEFAQVRIINTLQDVKKYLLQFLELLPEGMAWSPSTLINFGVIGENGPTGLSVYSWVLRNIRDNNKIDWLYVLIKMVPIEVLKLHPFVHRTREEIGLGTKGKTRGPMTTGRRIFVDTIEGRRKSYCVFPQTGLNPEVLLINKQEVMKVGKQRAALYRAVFKLSGFEWVVVNRFCNGEFVPKEEVELVILKLTAYLQEHNPELFDEENGAATRI